MTALTRPPGRLLTIADFTALGEDDRSRWELQEGSLVSSPSPTPRHMVAVAELYVQLRGQLPSHLRAVPDVDIDVELSGADQPGTARRPDLVVVEAAELDRVETSGGLMRASAVALVVEIVSPGSQRMDNVVKCGEYADAGIPQYWIVELDAPASLLACHLAGSFGYQDTGAATGAYEAREPFPLHTDLDALG
jgi:Uma2 family endonuclease